MAEASISGIEFKIIGSTGRAKTSVDKLTSSLRGLRAALQTSSTGKLKTDLDGIDKSAKKTTTTLGKLFNSIGRIGFYRAIRAALRFVTEGFKEGLQNAYQFSKIVGYELAGTMDTLATKSLTMKNQLGAAFGGLIMAIQPILLQIIALVTRAANAIAQLMAIIGGKTTYLKAIDTMTEYGEAVGGVGQAAKEAMKYLAPFDELNVLPSDSGGSGGGGSSVPDYSAMFEETPVSQALQDFVSEFKITVSDVLFDWSDLTGEQIAEKVLAGLFALTGAGVGFILGGIPGAVVGSIIGLTLGLIADTFIFDHDGVLEKSEIAHSLQYVLNALAGGVIGFTIGGVNGALIGAAIGLGLSLVAESVELLSGEGSISNEMVLDAIGTLAGGLIGLYFGGPGGAVLGATIGLGIALVANHLGITSGSVVNESVLLDQLTVALGALTGGIIGFSIGGPAGALIGATIGFGITAAITALKFNKEESILSGDSGRTGIDYFIVDVLGLPSDEDWKQYGRNIWKWLAEGVAEIKDELYNIFIKPIVDAFNEFAEEHPVIAAALGLENGLSDIGELGNQAASSMWGIEVEANITSANDLIADDERVLDDYTAEIETGDDEIPEDERKSNWWQAIITKTKEEIKDLRDKVLNGFTAEVETQEDIVDPKNKLLRDEIAVFGRVDTSELTEEQTKVDTTANFKTANKDNLEMKQRTFDARADFKYVAPIDTSTFTIDKRTFDAQANFKYVAPYSDSLPIDKRTFDAQANFKYTSPYANTFPMEKRTFDAQANFKYTAPYSNSYPMDKRTFDATANYKYTAPYSNSYPLDKRTFDAKADYKYTNNGLTLDQRTFDSVAKYKYRDDDDFPLSKRTFEAMAKYKYRNDDDFPLSKRTFESMADYKYRNDSLSDAQKTFLTTSEFYYDADSLSSSQKTFSTTSDFSYSKDSLSDAERTLKTLADLYSAGWHNNDTPYEYVYAVLLSGGWHNNETPSLPVNADLVYHLATGGSLYGGAWHDIPQYASGTTRAGSVFIAGEAGPEVVGHIGGRTEVLNQSQMASTMYSAVVSAMSTAINGMRFSIGGINTSTDSGNYDEEIMYRAMLRALNDSDAFPEIDLDGDVVYQKMVQRNQLNTRMTGRNAMAYT